MVNTLYELIRDSIVSKNPYMDKETLLSQLDMFLANNSLSEAECNELKLLLNPVEIVLE